MPVLALFDSGSEINAIYSFFAQELRLPIKPIDVKDQKIDGTTLNTFGMVVTGFLMIDKVNWVRFFKKTFLVANISPEVVFEMSFLTLSGADVDFSGWELRWRTYTTKKALSTTIYIELIGKKEFASAALDLEHKTYVAYVKSVSSVALPSFSPLKLNVYPFWRSQMSSLIAQGALIKVSAKYSDFADVLSPVLASELSELTRINNHAIKLVNS